MVHYKHFLNIGAVDVFTKCSAGAPEIANDRVQKGLERLKGRIRQGHLKFSVQHMKVHGDLVQATGDSHIGTSLRLNRQRLNC